MRDWLTALRTSRMLDGDDAGLADGANEGAPWRGVDATQTFIDRALRAEAPMREAPPAGLARRSMEAVHAARMAPTPARWGRVFAAGSVLGAVVMAAALLRAPARTLPTPAPTASWLELDAGTLTSLPRRGLAFEDALVREPLLREAQSLRDDTRRAAKVVMARLPIRAEW